MSQVQMEALEGRRLFSVITSSSVIIGVPSGETSSPGNVAGSIGDWTYYLGSSAETGRELWRLHEDIGPTLVKDFRPGEENGARWAGIAGGRIFIMAEAGLYEYDLWVSDGTDAGTVLLKEGVVGTNPVGLGDFVYFTDGRTGMWRSDGTIGGTVKVMTATVSGPGYAEVVGAASSHVLLYVRSASKTEIWSYDTATGTGEIVLSENASWSSMSRAAAMGRLYFGTESGVWETDGTAAGTRKIAPSGSVLQAADGGVVMKLTDGKFLWDGTLRPWKWELSASIGGTAYRSLGKGLYMDDGSADGVLIREFDDDIRQLAEYEGILYLLVDDKSIWSSDGTAGGTVRHAQAMDSPDGVSVGLAVTEAGVFVSNSGGGRTELERLDTSRKAPAALADTGVPAGDLPVERMSAMVNGRAVFGGADGVTWISDGTAGGTFALAGVPAGNSYVAALGKVFFSTPAGLYVTDGTSAGPQLNVGGNCAGVREIGGRVLFLAGADLWTTDGTAAGTMGVAASVTGLMEAADKAYFTSTDAGLRRLFVISEGGGLELLYNFGPHNGHVDWSLPGVELAGRLYFAEATAADAYSLWSTDGTAAGTNVLHKVSAWGAIARIPDALPGEMDWVIAATQQKVYFQTANDLYSYSATDDVVVKEKAWRADRLLALDDAVYGTWTFSPEPTKFSRLDSDFSYGKAVTQVARIGGEVYFVEGGRVLWKMNGTGNVATQVLSLDEIDAGASDLRLVGSVGERPLVQYATGGAGRLVFCDVEAQGPIAAGPRAILEGKAEGANGKFHFRAIYHDETGLDVATISTDAPRLLVVSPAGNRQFARLVGLKSSSDGQSATGIYEIDVPPIMEMPANNGYRVYSVAGGVRDVRGNALPVREIGKFEIVPTIAGTAQFVGSASVVAGTRRVVRVTLENHGPVTAKGDLALGIELREDPTRSQLFEGISIYHSRKVNLMPGRRQVFQVAVLIPEEMDGSRQLVVTPLISEWAGSVFSGQLVNVVPSAPDVTSRVVGRLATSVMGGTRGRLNVRVENIGPTVYRGEGRVGVYLSEDGVLDDSDTLLGWKPMPTVLPARGGRNVAFQFEYPTWLNGTYHVLTKVQPARDANASNDVTASAGKIAIAEPYVEISAEWAGAPVFMRSGTRVGVIVRNTGNVAFRGSLVLELWGTDVNTGLQRRVSFESRNGIVRAGGFARWMVVSDALEEDIARLEAPEWRVYWPMLGR